MSVKLLFNNKTQIMEIQKQQDADTLAQEQSYKQTKDNFKARIKELEKAQIETKAGRKDDDKSKMSFCQSKVMVQKYALRHWYMAYSKFRTKYSTYSKVMPVPNPDTVIDQDFINRIITEVGEKTFRFNKG